MAICPDRINPLWNTLQFSSLLHSYLQSLDAMFSRQFYGPPLTPKHVNLSPLQNTLSLHTNFQPASHPNMNLSWFELRRDKKRLDMLFTPQIQSSPSLLKYSGQYPDSLHFSSTVCSDFQSKENMSVRAKQMRKTFAQYCSKILKNIRNDFSLKIESLKYGNRPNPNNWASPRFGFARERSLSVRVGKTITTYGLSTLLATDGLARYMEKLLP